MNYKKPARITGFLFFPELKTTFALIVGLSEGIGEASLTLWLLFKGVRD